MKVSVIIPTYNRANYVGQAIDSVLCQTYQDIEIIVVDDGSTDNTRAVLEPYEKKIQCIYTSNGGPAHARNVGMNAATGEYISWLDSDDLYYPFKVEAQVIILDKYLDIALVCTETSAFDDHGFWDEYHLKKYHSSAYEREKIEYKDLFKEIYSANELGLDYGTLGNKSIYKGYIFDAYLQHIIVFTNSIMFRRDILQKIGLQNEQYRLFEDFDFVLRICKYFKTAFIDIPTYKLRYHDGQISGTAKKEGIQITIKKQINLLAIVEKYGVNDAEYYLLKKNAVDKRLAILNKALAIPLMAKGKLPKVAREHLSKCGQYGYHEYFLWIVTFAPYFIRRIVVKILAVLKVY